MQILEGVIGNQIEFLTTPLGSILFIIFYALWVTFLLPGSWISMLGGFVYGSLIGSGFVFLGACLGAILTFWFGRKIFRNLIEKYFSLNPKFQLIQDSIESEGLKLIFLTRLSPAFPFGLLNLAYGFSKVSFNNFLIGLLAILPGTFLYCSFGSFASDISKFNEVISNQTSMQSLLFTIIGFISTLLVVVVFVRALKRILEDKT